jgi:hypothetical protein
MLVVIILATMHFVSTHELHVRLVQDRTQKTFVDEGSRIESMLNNVYLRSTPFDDQEISIDQM